MALYMIGDVQGCDAPLGRLLDEIGFSPSRDTLYLLGDLVNRGPASLAVLRRLIALEGSAHCLLGNHDLHLLATAHGVRKTHRSDTVGDVLAAPDTMARAHELEAVLRGPDWSGFLQGMYGNEPPLWSDALRGAERLRVIVNAFTRLRFCTAQGVMEFESKDSSSAAPEGFMPWFDVPGRRTGGVPIAFGHWSTLGAVQRNDLQALDTGCVWGGCLTAARITGVPGQVERISVRCEQASKPGKR